MDTQAIERSGLIWGFDFQDGAARPVYAVAAPEDGAPAFRWLHLNLADVRIQRWIGACPLLPAQARDLLLSLDPRPHGLADGAAIAFVLPDIERDFDDGEPRLAPLRFALLPGLMITARLHPIRSADVLREKITAGAAPQDAGQALDLVMASMAETVRRIVFDTDAQVQKIEDRLLDTGRTPDARTFVALRGLMVRMHRLLTGARSAVRDFDEDAGAPEALTDILDRAGHRLAALDADLLQAQSQLRLLREEIDLQATQRTNQNLYILSILSALMLPATLVTGYFGMNTGGLPWQQHPVGTAFATVVAVGASAAVYIALRVAGFMKR